MQLEQSVFYNLKKEKFEIKKLHDRKKSIFSSKRKKKQKMKITKFIHDKISIKLCENLYSLFRNSIGKSNFHCGNQMSIDSKIRRIPQITQFPGTPVMYIRAYAYAHKTEEREVGAHHVQLYIIQQPFRWHHGVAVGVYGLLHHAGLSLSQCDTTYLRLPSPVGGKTTVNCDRWWLRSDSRSKYTRAQLAAHFRKFLRRLTRRFITKGRQVCWQVDSEAADHYRGYRCHFA